MEDEDPARAKRDERCLTNEKRLALFRVLFFGTFCIDIVYNITKARLYDAARISVPHFWFMRFLPETSPERVVVLWCLQSYAALQLVWNIQMRWTVPLIAALNFYTYFSSRIDSYQHHYMLWWLFVILSAVNWRRVRAWPLRLALVQASVVYFFAAVSKLEYLDRVHLLLPVQMNVQWLHFPIIYVQRIIGLSSDAPLWWLAGLSVLLLELFLSVAIHSRDESVRTATWMLGVGFHLAATVSNLKIRAFSFYMFALYSLVAPGWIVQFAWAVLPFLWRGVKDLAWAGTLGIFGPDDDGEESEAKWARRERAEEYRESKTKPAKNSSGSSSSNKRKKKKQQQQKKKQPPGAFRRVVTTSGEELFIPVVVNAVAKQQQQQQEDSDEGNSDEDSNRPSWKRFAPPPHMRKQEKAGCCLRCSMWSVGTFVCIMPFAPGWIMFGVWVVLTFFVLARPRRITRLRRMMFGYADDKRYSWYVSLFLFAIVANWCYAALHEHAFPYHTSVCAWNTVFWLVCALKTRKSRTPYTLAHMGETFLLSLLCKHFDFPYRVPL